ncbi:MAG: 4-phosphoerythronate dehydrogenase PdxB, partial [Mediterranea sp.]|nr:4-phosphoerythronate dehydrogenase PdxB [Mediterranea sp.]
MKVIVDNKIPYIQEAIRHLADEVVFLPGRAFTPELVHDADALIIRTRTRCNEELLRGSRVRFIATATIGFDHIDTDYCRRSGIRWANAPGCNSASVAQYVQSALLVWQGQRQKPLTGLTIGIVGAGHVGSKVAQVAHDFGMKVLLNDPPRAEREGEAAFSSLERLAAECDIISFHVPLSREDIHRTYHLADGDFFRRLQKSPLLINTSRGEVVDTEALLQALDSNFVSDAIIDVWEHEPDISPALLAKSLIGTPHIAGYSADGKANATRMSLDSLCRFFHIEAAYSIQPPAPPRPVIHAHSHEEALLQMYNPLDDSARLK